MNFAPISGRTVCALHCVLAMLSFCMSPLAALAAPPTNINPAPLIQNPRAVQRSIHEAHGEESADAAESDAMPRISDVVNTIESQDVGGERA